VGRDGTPTTSGTADDVVANPATGAQKLFDIEDEKKV